MITFLIAILFVALFVLGLSITIIRKGRPMQTDVGGNDEMKKRGLKCTSATARREEAEYLGLDTENKDFSCSSSGCDTLCGTCATPEQCDTKETSDKNAEKSQQ